MSNTWNASAWSCCWLCVALVDVKHPVSREVGDAGPSAPSLVLSGPSRVRLRTGESLECISDRTSKPSAVSLVREYLGKMTT